MYRIETKQGVVLGRYFNLLSARQVKQRIYRERKIWVNIVKGIDQ